MKGYLKEGYNKSTTTASWISRIFIYIIFILFLNTCFTFLCIGYLLIDTAQYVFEAIMYKILYEMPNNEKTLKYIQRTDRSLYCLFLIKTFICIGILIKLFIILC